jgi:hypothetical protein
LRLLETLWCRDGDELVQVRMTNETLLEASSSSTTHAGIHALLRGGLRKVGSWWRG